MKKIGSKNSNNFEIVHGDYKELFNHLISNDIKVDAVITDPPFNLVGTQGGEIHLFRQKGKHSKSNMSYDIDFDQVTWLLDLQKIVKPKGHVIIFNSWRNLGLMAEILEKNGFDIKQPGLWQKINPQPAMWDRRIVPGREYFLHAIRKGQRKGGHTFNAKSKLWNGTISGPLTSGWEKSYGYHPNQKPIYLGSELLEVFTNIGDTVLDPFMGSASIGVSSLLLGRNYFGSDLAQNKELPFEQTLKRLQDVDDFVLEHGTGQFELYKKTMKGGK